MATWCHVDAAFPPLGLLPGDVVRYDPDGESPVEMYRALPNGARPFWAAVLAGVVTPVDPGAPSLVLSSSPILCAPAPRDAAAPHPPPRLVKAG
jgi:hypothetical protein